LPPAVGLLLYNAAAFGEPLTVSYLALNGATFNLGFGARGYSVLDESLNRVARTAVFTPWRGVRTMLAHLGRANHTLAPIGLLIPIVALALAYTRTVRWRTLFAFSPLVLVHVFYFGTVMRFYSELFPFLFVGLAGTVVALALHDGKLASALAVVLLAGSFLLLAPGRASELPPTPWTRVRFWSSPGRVDTRAAIEALQREHERLLVFARGQRGWEGSFDYLYGYNAGGFDGAILVARDLGHDANRTLMRRFPDRAAFLAISRGRGEPAALLRLTQ
jgi:hypothetical protein